MSIGIIGIIPLMSIYYRGYKVAAPKTVKNLLNECLDLAYKEDIDDGLRLAKIIGRLHTLYFWAHGTNSISRLLSNLKIVDGELEKKAKHGRRKK